MRRESEMLLFFMALVGQRPEGAFKKIPSGAPAIGPRLLLAIPPPSSTALRSLNANTPPSL